MRSPVAWLRSKLEKFASTPASSPESGDEGTDHSFATSVRNALAGIVLAILTERHVRFEILAGVLACILAAVAGFTRIEWVLLLLNVALVLGFEVKNTSVELSVDLSTREFNEYARRAKDAASGAVLIVAIVSAVNGLLLFGPWLLGVATRVVESL